MSLKVPSIYKLPSDTLSAEYSDLWGLTSPSMSNAILIANNYSEYGMLPQASNKYKGAMICLYLLWLSSLIRKEYNTGSPIITTEYLYEKYKIDCVKNNLLCFGKTYGINYVKLFDNLLTIEGEFTLNEFIEIEFTKKTIL